MPADRMSGKAGRLISLDWARPKRGLGKAPVLAANLGLIVTVAMWGAQVPVLHDLTTRWSPFFLSLLRYLAAVPVFLVLVLLFEGMPSAAPRVAPWRLALLGGAIALFSLLYTFGVANSNPITAAVISATSPVIASLVAWLALRVKPGRAVWLALLLVVPGGLLAMVDWSAPQGPLGLRGGEILIVAAIACWSWYSIMAQRWLAGRSPLRITGLSAAAACPVLLVGYLAADLAGLTYGELGAMSLKDMGFLAMIVLGVVVLGIVLWNNGVARLGLPVAALYLNLIPVAALLVALAFGVMPRAEQLMGGALVILGVILAQVIRAPRRPPQAEEETP